MKIFESTFFSLKQNHLVVSLDGNQGAGLFKILDTCIANKECRREKSTSLPPFVNIWTSSDNPRLPRVMTARHRSGPRGGAGPAQPGDKPAPVPLPPVRSVSVAAVRSLYLLSGL